MFSTYIKDKFVFLFISLLMYIAITPFLGEFVRFRLILDIFFTAILLSAIYAVSQNRIQTIITTLIALPAIGSTWLAQFIKTPVLIFIDNFFGILFLIFTMLSILSFIFKTRKITRDVIYASIVVYLLMGVLGGVVFYLLESFHPGSFAIKETIIKNKRMVFTYYSFITLTTLGYGDVTPLTEQAAALAMIEAVIGQIYLLVLVARLVGLHISQSMYEKPE